MTKYKKLTTKSTFYQSIFVEEIPVPLCFNDLIIVVDNLNYKG